VKRAVFSPCGQFRYLLAEVWDESKPILPWCLLNPSIAGRDNDDGTIAEDPTWRKGRGFSTKFGYGGQVFVNPWAYVATDFDDLKAAGYPVGPANDEHILEACAMGDGTVVVAWGRNAKGLSRPAEVLSLIRRAGYRPMALALTKDGLPGHPLMLPLLVRTQGVRSSAESHRGAKAMSDLPIVAYRYRGFSPFPKDGEYRQSSSYAYIPNPMQMDALSHDCGAVAEPLADHAAATASLASAQQRIEELAIQVRQADERGDEAMRRAHAAEARVEELERALGAEVTPCRGLLDSKCKYLTHCGALCKKCGRQHDGQPAPNPGLAAAVLDFLRAVDDRHDSNHAPLKYTVPWGAVNALRAAVGTSPGVARGIVSPEGIETGTGSTAKPPEPGPAGARPSKGFLKGESPQATWPFAQDDKGTK
jgi:hypothetical protein